MPTRRDVPGPSFRGGDVRTLESFRIFRCSTWIAVALGLFAPAAAAAAPAQNVASQAFVAEVTQFLEKEMAAHVAAVHTLDPPQPSVLGVPTKGDFTWGSLMRALADVAALSNRRTLGGRDVPQLLGKLGLIEAAAGGK